MKGLKRMKLKKLFRIGRLKTPFMPSLSFVVKLPR